MLLQLPSRQLVLLVLQSWLTPPSPPPTQTTGVNYRGDELAFPDAVAGIDEEGRFTFDTPLDPGMYTVIVMAILTVIAMTDRARLYFILYTVYICCICMY